ncbi:LMBR1 domain-containing protein 2 homolog A-like [Chenopodium quinoa]|uniref:LMBR1 domain-containing protein 2 homolog A-like n=1 Tax=Chenopodium quinoa TaxID=63459 RepID=UPI000B796CD1|nr:LMBR1 domain-containing protein 2 homolog A-like [Chenopodium quinoa]
MWVFYLISLPMTLGMVVITLKYFAGPHVPRYVFLTVGYAWFCSLSIIILVPADIWTTVNGHYNGVISFLWSWSYWSTFLLTWAVVPLIQGYEDAGDFTLTERLKTSVHVNLVFYLIVGSIGLLGLILLFTMRRKLKGGVLGFAMACSNTFGLVTGAFLLGFGLSEIPRSLWKNADWTFRQKLLSHKIAKMASKLDEAHQNFSNAIVVAQATSNQMSKRDPLRPYMDVIDKMLTEMFKEDPSFKPQGGRLGENDMDYDADDKSMAQLRRQLRVAQEEYYRYKSEYMTYVLEALELEDTIKNYERRHANGWKFISSLRGSRPGRIGSFLDTIELLWRCILRKQLQKLLAIVLGCMSVAILLAEATLLPNVDLSLFSILIKSVGRRELFVQVFAFIPLMYMCICTYYSLLKIGMLMFYSLTPRQTSSVNLLMICSMVARYAPPVSYNFLNLIRLDGNAKTIFEKRMGNIDDAVPFFGRRFNKIYPLIMVVYTILVASNFFDRVMNFFGSWKRLRFQSEAEDLDGFDPSGMIILQKERSWLEQGHKVGEQVIPLARNFNGLSVDVETGIKSKGDPAVEMKGSSSMNDIKGSMGKTSKSEAWQSIGNREVIGHKYAVMREQNKQTSSSKPAENTIAAAKVSLLNSETSSSANDLRRTSSGMSSTWQSMKMGFNNFKTNLEAKKFLPLKQSQEPKLLSHNSSSESLDEIFQRLKRPTVDSTTYVYDDDYDDDNDTEIRKSGSKR